MSTLSVQRDATIVDVMVEPDALRVFLVDGRELKAPLAWFPLLRDASRSQQANWRLIGRGEGIHWPDLDEDVSVAGLLGLSD